MNKIWIWIGVIVIVVVGTYLIFMHRPSVSPVAQNSSCLTQGEVASNETSTTGNYIVVRDSKTNAEISQFALPTSTVSVNNIGQCNVNVTEADNYGSAQINLGAVYNLPVGGSIDRWQYSYNGNGQKILTIVSSTASVTGLTSLKIDPTDRYISFVAVAEDDYEIQIYDLNTGVQLFSSNLSQFPAKYGIPPEGLDIWEENPNSVEWRYANGDEILDIPLEGNVSGGAGGISIDTKNWSVKAE